MHVQDIRVVLSSNSSAMWQVLNKQDARSVPNLSSWLCWPEAGFQIFQTRWTIAGPLLTLFFGCWPVVVKLSCVASNNALSKTVCFLVGLRQKCLEHGNSHSLLVVIEIFRDPLGGQLSHAQTNMRNCMKTILWNVWSPGYFRHFHSQPAGSNLPGLLDHAWILQLSIWPVYMKCIWRCTVTSEVLLWG